MTINRQWHEAHRLPRISSFEKRILWHREHAAVCGCRNVPADIRRELERRGQWTPSPMRKAG